MTMPTSFPPHTSAKTKKVYAYLFGAAAFAIVVATLLAQIEPIGSSLSGICRDLRVCSVRPLGNMPALSSGYERGNNASKATHNDLVKYSNDNPDWDICYRNVQSHDTSGPANTNVEWRIQADYYGRKKWHGLFERIYAWCFGSSDDPKEHTGLCRPS